MSTKVAFCLLVLLVVIFAQAVPVSAGPPRAVYFGQQAPSGVSVLDRRGELWLVTGTAEKLLALPGVEMLSEPVVTFPSRTFSPALSPFINDLVAEINAPDLVAQVEWLIGLGTRVSISNNIFAVADSLEAKLASFGLATEQHLFPLSTLTAPNVVATKVGTVQPDSVFVICAHYDATSEMPRYSTPGADDNGTGTAAVLTAARLLSSVSLNYTVKFVLFAGEEQGMVGSQHWVADMAAAGLPILGALNVDMVGWWEEGVPFDLEIETNEASLWLAEAICWAADTYTTMPYELHVYDSAYWGDFYSFWQHGYAAVNHEEAWDWFDPDFNPNYHTTQDTADKLSPEFFEGSVRIAVAAVATLAEVSDLSPVPSNTTDGISLSASPNPFNGRVVFSLTAEGALGPQQVSIYDLHGRHIGDLNLTMNGGRSEGVWDARDDDGRSVPAGIYLARAGSLPGTPSCRVTYVP